MFLEFGKGRWQPNKDVSSVFISGVADSGIFFKVDKRNQLSLLWSDLLLMKNTEGLKCLSVH